VTATVFPESGLGPGVMATSNVEVKAEQVTDQQVRCNESMCEDVELSWHS